MKLLRKYWDVAAISALGAAAFLLISLGESLRFRPASLVGGALFAFNCVFVVGVSLFHLGESYGKTHS